MHKEEFENQCLLYRYGELPGDEAASFREHLAGCPECQKMLRDLGKADSWIAASSREPSDEVLEKVYSVLGTGPVQVPYRAPRRRIFLYPSLAFALALFAVIFYWGGRPGIEEDILAWTDGVEEDIQRLDRELVLARGGFGFGLEPQDSFYDELERIEEFRDSLENELKGGV